jgi:hypothetical protein
MLLYSPLDSLDYDFGCNGPDYYAGYYNNDDPPSGTIARLVWILFSRMFSQ